MLYFLLFIVGNLIGSYLNVVSLRTIKGENHTAGRSKCSHCSQTISWYDNIPIISYLFLKGKCRNCKTPISKQYPFIEILTGLLFLLGGTYSQRPIVGALFIVVTCILLVISIIDWHEKMIYLKHLIFLLTAVVLLRLFNGFSQDYLMEISGLLVFGGFLFIVRFLAGLFYKKEAMGIGDVQLALICGLLFDWKGAAVALYISFISASVIGIIKLKIIKSEDKIIPFGPFIAFGSVISFIFSEQILGLFFDLYL